jgi:hypothetical protein
VSAYFDLDDEGERRHALAYLAKGILNPRRNGEQNRLLHALLGEISRQVEWGGKKWDVDDWKRLLTAAWLRAKGQHVAMVPAVDGQGFDVLYQRTSTLSKGEFADLVDYIHSWAAEQDILLPEAV